VAETWRNNVQSREKLVEHHLSQTPTAIKPVAVFKDLYGNLRDLMQL